MQNALKSAGGRFCALLVGMMVTGVASGSDVIVRTYESPLGESFGAISVKMPRSAGQTASGEQGGLDHAVLVDTSASQVGEHREFAFAALRTFLESLPEGDRVAVFAVDVKTVPLTEGLVSAPDALTAALDQLEERFPAGSTDLPQALETATETLAHSERGSVLLIGDGMSAAHLLQMEQVQSLTEDFRNRRIPIHAFAVGASKDLRLLGTLGMETGGFVMQDEWGPQSLDSEQVGALLAEVVARPVFYPTEVTPKWESAELLPNRPLPIRSDRETVFLTRGELAPGASLAVSDGERTQTWNVPDEIRTVGNTFLAHLWNLNAPQDGVGLGLAGDWMVNLAHQTFEDHVALLGEQGEQALAQGENGLAEKIGFHLQEIDPKNTQAVSLIQRAGGERDVLQVAQVEKEADQDAPAEEPEPAAEPSDNPDFADRELPPDLDAIEAFDRMRAARGQKMRREVQAQIEQARELLEIDADRSEDILDRSRMAIKSATDIDPELRNQLLRQVSAALDDIRSRRRQIATIVAERQRKLAEQEAQAKLIEYAVERDQQLEQMVDRIRALMVEGFQGDPEAFEEAEAVAREVLSEYPNSAIGRATVVTTEAAGQLDKANRLRDLRADRFLEVLYQAELAHVPFPDEPPLVYPPAEVWWALTEMREKWKSVDLRRDSPNEERIYRALGEVTSVEFPGNPLSDVIDFISTQHNIPILLDTNTLADEGIGPDEEISLILSGITLRSALKLMLENVGGIELTYIIEDEVMKITTALKADEIMQTRVYPVGDLVIPVQPLMGGMGAMMMGGGMMGGGMGGMGGGMGGMGGGMGGMGGMGGGMGGMGGGMGMFSVPVPPLNADELPNPQADGKKKPM
jgi:hypothetical protein